MDRSRKLIFYLVLNVLVSACTVTAVLVIWNYLIKPVSVPVVPVNGTQAPVSTPTQNPSKQSYPKGKLVIDNVIGVGSISNEVVVLKREGTGELPLEGWQLKDQDGHEFTFPALTLFEGGAIRIFSRADQNTPLELFWNQTKAVWQIGEKVTLLDPSGKIQVEYTIP
jgi:hypothetical protein